MERLRFGFVGTGMMGRQHIKAVRDHYPEEAEVAAICDANPGELSQASELVPEAHRYSDYREMLEKEDLDGVFISTPNFLHAEMAVYSLKRGINVFSEKPVATTKEDCLRMVEAADEAGKVLMIGHELRYAEYFRTIKRILEEGRIGRPYLVWCKEFRGPFFPKIDNWIQDSRRSGGALVDKNSHHFDLMNWYVGSRPTRVFGMGGKEVVEVIGGEEEVIDHAVVSVEYEDRVKGCLLLCMFAPSENEDALEFGVLGDRGMLRTKISSNDILVWEREKEEEVEYVNRVQVLKKEGNNLITYKIAPMKEEWGGHYGFREEHGAFIEAIRKGERPLTDVRECLYGTLIPIAAEESIRTGKVVEMEEWP
ncbi:MAG TPA: Gfo/Idh/MocA family oxidoreductase [Candidatus Latescibacteria bacterium]|nr:Gfo/Idh/MocA family oxidoreductase [Candidatus Latescibacterota bacterium]